MNGQNQDLTGALDTGMVYLTPEPSGPRGPEPQQGTRSVRATEEATVVTTTTQVKTPEVVTITARCEAGLCGSCRGQVLSMTGDRPCGHACHKERELT